MEWSSTNLRFRPRKMRSKASLPSARFSSGGLRPAQLWWRRGRLQHWCDWNMFSFNVGIAMSFAPSPSHHFYGWDSNHQKLVVYDIAIPTLCGGLEHVLFLSSQLGMAPSQLTLGISPKKRWEVGGWSPVPTRQSWTRKQHRDLQPNPAGSFHMSWKRIFKSTEHPISGNM